MKFSNWPSTGAGEHLHRFRIHGRDYGASLCGGITFDQDARQVPLARFRLHNGERFRYEYDFTAGWALDVRLEEVLPWDARRFAPVCTGGSRAAPPEDCAEARDYLERLHRHRHEWPIDDLALMAETLQRFLDSGGDRKALGNRKELCDAADRVTTYQEFQPLRFDRRQELPQPDTPFLPGEIEPGVRRPFVRRSTPLPAS